MRISLVFVSIFLFISLCTVSFAAMQKAPVDVPNPCVELEKVEGSKVYFKSSGSACINVLSKKTIDLDTEVKDVTIYVDGSVWKLQKLDNFNMGSIQARMDEISEMKKDMAVPENANTKKAAIAAEESFRYYNSEEFQKKLTQEKNRILNDIFPDQVSSYYKDLKKSSSGAGLTSSERIYIFISSSVPIETLRNYAADIDKLGENGIVLVLRGFVGDFKYVSPTIKFSSQILFKDRDCDISTGSCESYRANLEIDPLLFRRYQITQVPAFVYAPQVNVVDVGMSEGIVSNASVGNSYVIYGDVSLEYVLEQFQKTTPKNSLNELLAGLRTGFFQ